MGNPQRTIRFSVSLPKALLDELDRRVVARGYDSRSELVRDLIRERMIETRWAAGNTVVVGILTIIYDHHQPDLVNRIMEAQHSRFVNVLCTTHVHLDHHHCLECIIIKGRPGEIESIASAVGGLRGVTSCGLTRTSTLPS
jgi:CopG family nickel-responsive transcriptional regulator